MFFVCDVWLNSFVMLEIFVIKCIDLSDVLCC